MAVMTSERYRKVQDGVVDSAHKIWLAGLGAVSLVEEEGAEILTRLVEKGREWQGRSRDELEEARERVTEGLDEARDKVSGSLGSTVEKVGGRFDEGVAAVLNRMGIPRRDEVLALTERIERLDELVDKVRAARAEAARTVYHVAPQDDGWKVLVEGAGKPLSTHATKKAALDDARDRARADEPSALVIHRADGTIQSRSSYGEAL